MDNASIFLDDGAFMRIKDSNSGEAFFEQLKRILGDILVQDFPIFSCDIFSVPTGIENGAALYEWIYSNPSLAGLDPTDARDVIVLLQRCREWEDVANPPPQLIWEEDRSLAASAACFHAWQEPQESELPGLISVGDERFNDVATLSDDAARRKKVFVLSTGSDVVAYYRAILRTTRNHDDVFQALAPTAFPLLIFAQDLAPTSLEVDLDTHMARIVHHLSFLCDRYCAVGDDVAWDQFRICRAAEALGIDMSDESPNTKANAYAMRQRRVSVRIDGVLKDYSCTLHTKLEPTKGRIHFYVERMDNAHRVIVGLFEKHLAT